MATPQDPYADVVKQSQDAMRAAFDTWAQSVQQVFGQFSGAAPVGPEQVIDQVFDFAIKMLNAQRDFAKQLAASSRTTAESVRSSVTPGS